MNRQTQIFLSLLSLSLLFAHLPLARATTEEVQTAIIVNAKAWVASDTSVSVLPHAERRKRLGLVPNTAQTPLVLAPSPQPGDSLPSTVNWAPYVTPVKDQGSCGSCWAFSTTGALESYNLRHDQSPGGMDSRAEEILLSCSTAGSCKGGYLDKAGTFVQRTGLPPESYFPYTQGAPDDRCSNAQAGWRSQTRRIGAWLPVTSDLSTIKSALQAHGPLVTAFEVYSDFYYYTSGIYEHVSGTYEGSHAVLLTAYQDDASVPGGGYFTAKNSWGQWWGEDGFVRIAYGEISTATQFGEQILAYVEPVTLSIASQHPDSGVAISISPADSQGSRNGTAPLTRTYAPNTTVTLTAPMTLKTGIFTKWQEDGADYSTNNRTSLVMDADHTLTAVYTPATTITLATHPARLSLSYDQGRATTSPLTLAWVAGTTHQITAAASQQRGSQTRYQFTGWSDGGAASHPITVPDSPATYTANYTAQYQLKTSVKGAGTLTISLTSADGYYPAGTTLQITAQSDPGTIITWSRPCTGQGTTCTLTLNGPANLQAGFAVERPVLSITPSASSVVKCGSEDVGKTRTCLANPAFRVSNRGTGTLTGSVTITSGPYTITEGGSFSLPAGSSQLVHLTVTPSATGQVTGTLHFSSNAGEDTRTVQAVGL